MRVLIAEDEPRVGDAVARGLRREGMAVDLARDGATALRKALAASYDVVVLDRDLPELHGDDVCRTLTAERPETKVLMLTAAAGAHRGRPGARSRPARGHPRGEADRAGAEGAGRPRGADERQRRGGGARGAAREGLGRGDRPVHEHGPDDRDDAAPKARGPACGPHRARRRLPRVTVRLRLTLLYTLLFGASGAVLLGVSAWLVHRHVERTLPAGLAHDALARLDAQYVLALGGTLVVAFAPGGLVAGRALAPLRNVTALARRVTQERLDERIDLRGPADELHELADTVDGMLDRLSAAFDGQRRFVANASHELRTPLTVIRAEVDVALADPDATIADLRHMGEVVLEATDRTQALLDSLMVLARSQQALPRREPVDLAAAARTAVAVTAGAGAGRRGGAPPP